MPRRSAGIAGHCLLLVLVVFGVYAASLANQFVYDDSILIVNNESIKSLRSAPKAFLVSYYPGLSYYRPVGLISYMVDHAIWGMRPLGFHLTNVVLHSAATVLVFLMFLRALPEAGKAAAMAGSLLFAVHPVASSVAYPITAREAIWCVVFCAGAVLLFLRRSPGARIGAVVCFGLALLSKEPAVALPFCLLAIDRCTRPWQAGARKSRAAKELIAAHAPFFALLAAYVALRVVVLDLGFGPDETDGGMHTFFASWLYLAQTLLLPTIQLIYEPSLATWFSPLKAVVVAAAVVVVAVLVARASPPRRRYALAWLVWTVASFLPTANMVSQETKWDERYQYMPAIGIVGIVLSLAAGGGPLAALRRELRAGAVAVVCLALAAISVSRARYWHDNEAFHRQWLSHAPFRTSPNYGMAKVLEKKGNKTGAIKLYRRALIAEPDHEDSRTNLAIDLADLGRFAEAVEEFQILLRYHPDSAKGHFNMGVALEGLGRIDEARRAYERAIELDANHVDARNNLGLLLGRAGDFDAAIAQFRLAVQADKRFIKGYNNLALGLVAKHEYGEAIAVLRAARKLAPEDLSLARNLSRLLAKCPDRRLRDGQEAVRLAETVSRSAGGSDPLALDVLAAAYAEVGRFDDAAETIGRAIEFAVAAGRDELAARFADARALYLQKRRYEGPP